MALIKIEGKTVGISADGITVITKDKTIPHQAIMSSSSLEVYYDGTPETTLFWEASVPMPVHPDMRLVTTTTCWTYGVRS